jgi:hypothetical protein
MIWALVLAGPLLTAVSAMGQTYSLLGDWNGVSNPNGVWSYGYFSPSISSSDFNSFGTGSSDAYGTAGSDFEIYQNQDSFANYGIAPGQISLEADGGNPDVRFTAPVSGNYQFSLAIGGTEASEGDGYGNHDAANAGLMINGTTITGTYSSGTNIYSWNFDQTLNAGDIVDAYVGAGFGGGNTQTVLTISVPEPATAGVALGAAAMLMLSRPRGKPRVG